jgi:hypothetical protein
MVTVHQVDSEVGTVEKAQFPNLAHIIKTRTEGKAQPTNLGTIKTTKFIEP